ncbi:MAG: hypothetical protein HKN58_10000 [Xanthomonadales bacterium]|nr:hypothetical protein [Xanthomonadales bacterium]
MNPRDDDVVVTGAGVVMPGSNDRATFWRRLAGQSSQITVESFENGRRYPLGRCRPNGLTGSLNAGVQDRFERLPRDIQLYAESLAGALEDAGLARQDVIGERAGIYSGSSRGPFLYWDGSYRDRLRREDDLTFGVPGQASAFGALLTGVTGPVHTFSNSCCSGAVAMDFASSDLLRDRVDIALVSGHEATLCARFFSGFREAGILAVPTPEPARLYRVYHQPSGVVFAEAAITLVCERRSTAVARGARILGTFGGYAYGNHALHPTNVDPSTDRPYELVQQLFRQLGIGPSDVGFVIGHGNGVPASDLAELTWMRRVFGDGVADVPLFSVKPVVGHSIGASSTASFLASLQIAAAGHVPRLTNLDPGADDEFNFGGMDIPRANWKVGLSVSYGIGGHHAMMAVLRPDGELEHD